MEEFESIVRVLRFFAATRNYSFLDRIGNALNPETVEVALRDALRTFSSIYDASPADEKGLKYYEYEEGRRIRLPAKPSEGEVAAFLRAVWQDVGVARRVAIMAMSVPAREER
ncbi:type I-A CRISPR-associated protein Csa5 [Infirmifilum lucidum]|uniref:Type I-A CRISPR-associated protein Csa5 n=1 Tax=Infirmifilum lucidum TaxID=2776706 RepID=A0A7L9FLH5_9CREN|nr:type I-A CRISPR-associated protein Csa5 [Infirmifilum lucidum]